ncbi:hypothetical protein ATY79_14955 [Rhizobium sp. R693]|nr:hypothetical protein ATY79_14955 [Rhizobium sp. R693]
MAQLSFSAFMLSPQLDTVAFQAACVVQYRRRALQVLGIRAQFFRYSRILETSLLVSYLT